MTEKLLGSIGQNSTFSRTAPTQTNKDICTGTTCADPGIFFVRGEGVGSRLLNLFYSLQRGPVVLLHIFQRGGPNASFYRNPYNYNL